MIEIVFLFILLHITFISTAEAKQCTYTPSPSNFQNKANYYLKLQTNDSTFSGVALASINIQHSSRKFPKNGKISLKINNSAHNLYEDDSLTNSKRGIRYLAGNDEKIAYFPIATYTNDFSVKIDHNAIGTEDDHIFEWNVKVTCTTKDTIKPSIRITSPTSQSSYTTNQSSIKIAGTATDNIAIDKVEWSIIDTGTNGTVDKVTSNWSQWSKTITGLSSGANRIKVTAYDEAGNTDTDIITVTYEKPIVTKTLTISSPSNGRITDNKSKISCPSVCKAIYDEGTNITLSARPNSGFKFDGFSGCTANGLDCTFALSQNKTISAVFSPVTSTTSRLRVSVPTPNGTVSSSPAGISNCGKTQGTCEKDFDKNATITLTATPDPNYVVKYASCTSISENSCRVDLTSDKTVIATFEPKEVVDSDLKLEFDTFPQRYTYGQKEKISIKLRVKSSNLNAIVNRVDVDWTGSAGSYVTACTADQGGGIAVETLLDCNTLGLADLPINIHTLTATAYGADNKPSNNTLKFIYKVQKENTIEEHLIGTQNAEQMKKFWVIDPNTDKKGYYVDTARGTQVLQLNFLHQTGIMGLDYSLQYNSGFAKQEGKKLGKGWNHNYGMFAHLDTSKSANKLILKWSNNRELTYTKDGDEYIDKNAPEQGRLSGYYDRITHDKDGYLLTKKDKSKYRFSATTGNLTFIKNKHQQVLALDYANGKLAKIREIDHANKDTGIYLTYEYDEYEQIEFVRDAAERTVQHYYQDSCLVAIKDPEGREHKFTLKAGTCLITGYQRHKNNTSVILFRNNQYGTFDEVTAQTDGNGKTTTFAYNESKRPGLIETTITTPLGIVTEDIYNSNYQLMEHRVVSATNSNQVYSTQYGYTPSGMLRRKREHGLQAKQNLNSKNGRITEYEYDKNGNTTKIIYPDGNFITRSYDDDNNLIKAVSETQQQTTYSYNTDNNKLNTATTQYGEGERATTTYTYNEDAQPTIIKPPRSKATTISYDENSRIKTTSDSEGNTTTLAYDRVGNAIKVTIKNADGSLANEVSTQVDKLGRVIQETSQYSGKTLTVDSTYSLCGGLASMTDANRNTTTTRYDGNCNLKQIQAPLNKTTTLFYDADNRKIGVKDAEDSDHSKKEETIKYNALGQVTEHLNGESKSILLNEYDQYSNLQTVTEQADGLGGNSFITRYNEYDNRNHLSRTDDAHHKTTYRRGQYGRISNINEFDDCPTGRENCTASTRKKSFVYYADNKIKQVTAPVTNIKDIIASQRFDADGNRTQLKDPRESTTGFDFDGNNQEKKQTPAAGEASNKQYNALQLLAWVKNGRGQKESYTYYENGWLKTITQDSDSKTYTYSYDNNGNVLTIVGSDNSKIERHYDALNRVTDYKDPLGNVIKYSYYKNSQLETIRYDGHTVSYTYDGDNRMQNVSWDNKEVVSYTYTHQGRLKKETRSNGTMREYSYEKGRLVTISDKKGSNPIVTFSFNYNAVGDITKETITPEPTPDALLISPTRMTYDNASNRLATYNGKTVSFDNDGNMTTGPLGDDFATFVYDQRNRLIKAGATSYDYTIENHRIGVKQDNKTTTYLVNPHAELSQVLSKQEADGTKTYYIYGLGLVAQIEKTKQHFYHYDLRGSTVALTDVSGNVTDRFGYMPYGNYYKYSGNTNTPFLFIGKYGVSVESNSMYRMRFRYYGTSIRRFINKDIIIGDISSSLSLNRYAYAFLNPVSYIDRSGNFPELPFPSLSDFAEAGKAAGRFSFAFSEGVYKEVIHEPGLAMAHGVENAITNFENAEGGVESGFAILGGIGDTFTQPIKALGVIDPLTYTKSATNTLISSSSMSNLDKEKYLSISNKTHAVLGILNSIKDARTYQNRTLLFKQKMDDALLIRYKNNYAEASTLIPTFMQMKFAVRQRAKAVYDPKWMTGFKRARADFFGGVVQTSEAFSAEKVVEGE